MGVGESDGEVPGVASTLEWARFEPRSERGEGNKTTSSLPPHPTHAHNPQMLSIALRTSLARRVPAATIPMLGRGLSNVYSEGSVAQSRGFKSVPLFAGFYFPSSFFRGLTELLTLFFFFFLQ